MAISNIEVVEAARQRRSDRAAQATLRTEWFIQEVSQNVRMQLGQRVRLATELVKNRVVFNISRPVTKTVVGRETVVTDRSKPGEFPKADTTQLMKTIFSAYDFYQQNAPTGYVGTPIDYGLRLEINMDRSFLVRTLNESRNDIVRILTGPIT